ncbi:MAG: hypothetical protein ACW98F_15620 [Candidatus Hodarchaeales archaeon]
MAQLLYRNLWAPRELRTLLLGVLMITLGFLLELIFLFFLEDIRNSFLGVLYWELSLLGGSTTPLLILFHLIIWSVIFFATLMVYTVIREYSGGRTGISEIAGIVIVLTITTGLIFDEWFALFFLIASTLITGYLYLAVGE